MSAVGIALGLVAAAALFFAGWGACVHFLARHYIRGGSLWDFLPWRITCARCGARRGRRAVVALLLLAALPGCAAVLSPLSPEPAVSAVVAYADYLGECPICQDRDVHRSECRLAAVSPSFSPDAVDRARLKCFFSCSAGHSWAVTR